MRINLLNDIELPELRRQDTKNRQNSIDDLDPEVVEKLNRQMVTLFSSIQSLSTDVGTWCGKRMLAALFSLSQLQQKCI